MAPRTARIRLHSHIVDQWATEGEIQRRLRSWAIRVSANPGASAAVGRLHTMVRSQREALRLRLQAIGTRPSVRARASSGRAMATAPAYPRSRSVAAAIREAFTACTHAAFGYATLHAIAHRFFDRTTADIAEQHLRAYASFARDLNALISDVVVWELTHQGQECQCQCPSCGVGICVCAPHGMATVEDAWREPPVAAGQPGMLVRPPRATSAAARAGLRAGDVVVAVDDQEVRSIDDIQNGIRKRNPGEEIALRVRRGSDQSFDTVITRPQPTN